APYSMFADKRIRVLLHAKFKVLGIDRRDSKTIIKPLVLQYNDQIDKTYEKRLKMRLDNGNYYIVDEWAVPRPSDAIIDAYEKKKAEFNARLNKEIMGEFLNDKNGKKVTVNTTAAQDKVLKLLQSGLTIPKISEELDCSPQNVDRHVQRLRNKGYHIQAVKNHISIDHYEVTIPD
ncbi:unnamed protein product, partial [marine sediment metagenome]